jgi:hypothetical protein
MKSKKNRKTIKHIYKINTKRKLHKSNWIRHTTKNKKYTRGGAAFAKAAAKRAGKRVAARAKSEGKKLVKDVQTQAKGAMKDLQAAAKDPKALMSQGSEMLKGLMSAQGQSPGQAQGQSPGQAQGQSPGQAQGQSPGQAQGQAQGQAADARQGASLMKSAMSLKKFTPAGMMLSSFSGEKDIKYYFKKGMYALYKVMSSLITIPIRNLDEVIPPELCKKFTDNNFVCSQSMIQYLLTGSKPDYKKILLEKDSKDCTVFDEDGNKIIKCKKPDTIQHGGNIVIGCDAKENPKFKINDRVIVVDTEQNNENAAYIELNDTKWLIGTIKGVKDDYAIQIDNGGILNRPHTVTEDQMRIYDNDWNEFYKEFYNIPKLVLKNLYDIIYELGEKYFNPMVERINKIMKLIYKKSGIYQIVKIFSFIYKKVWVCHNMLLQMDKDNILFIALNKLVESYKDKNIWGTKQLNMIVTFNCIVMIYNQYLNGKSIDQTLAILDDNDKRIQLAVGKKLKLMQEKLVKFNLYLRKYECPMNKLKSLIDKINDVELLEKMLESLDKLLDLDNYEQINGEDEKENRKKRIQSCDSKYDNYDLSIIPDSTIMEFEIDPEKQTPTCKSCSGNAWTEVIVRYGCFFSKSLNGNKNNMTYILMNIVQDMATLNESTDGVIQNIKYILKNIECRSNLRKVITTRIEELKTPNKNVEGGEDNEDIEDDDPDALVNP